MVIDKGAPEKTRNLLYGCAAFADEHGSGLEVRNKASRPRLCSCRSRTPEGLFACVHRNDSLV